MKKTVYLNLNLDNPKDLALYNFLEDLGREKKAILYYLLDKQGCFAEASEVQPVRIPSEKKRQSVSVARAVPTKEEPVAETVAIPVERKEASVQTTPAHIAEEESEREVPSREDVVSIPKEDLNSNGLQRKWTSYFSPEQVETIKSISHVFEGIETLTPYQQQVMAEELGDETDDYAIKGAFEEAKFAHE